MKNQSILFSLLIASSLLIGGGNIEPESSATVPITSSSSSTPSLPSVTMIDGMSNTSPVTSTSNNTDLVFKERGQGILWQDEKYTDEENGAFKREHSNKKAGNFAHATQYCASLDYAGFTDWRLPTSDELTRVHYAIGDIFVNTRDNDFWSSTPTTRDKYYVVFPTDAMRYARSARQSNFIRCVRDIIE